ncbi:HEAT repeat domain-containing protein [Nocardia sp. NPDC051787]|uniref:HEAT repeat domain-containing protein n=1 Tax=Nocardia sp. NPDC051787 TaxID=3155415 RepID=UPI00343A9131
MELTQALADSRSVDWKVRESAAIELGRLLPSDEAMNRLAELLGDENMAVELEATEVLARFGGHAGLVAILGELGRRVDDPDSDYIAYRLQELQTNDQLPILQNAREILSQSPPSDVSEGINQIEQLFGYLAPRDQ